MANRLSYSSINKHSFCQTAYKNHYLLNYRSTEIPSSLVFGSALGKSIETISKPGIELDNSLSTPTDEEIFDYQWTYQTVNDVLVNLKTSTVNYLKTDLDFELLTEEEKKECGTDNEQLANWYSLRHKGHLMLKAYREQILPQITKIHSVEEKIELENDIGDSSIGYCDAVVSIKGYDKPIILDFKTAGRSYDENSVIRSVQLSGYLHVLSEKYDNTRLAAYCVFLKNIKKDRIKKCIKCGHIGEGSHKSCDKEINNKRCNGSWDIKTTFKCETQLIIDEIPQQVENLVIENIEAVNNSIKTGVFTKNLSGCFDDYGKNCVYQKLCWENSTEGLIKVDKKS